MSDYGIEKGRISQLRQRFEKKPPPKPPKPKHLSRPQSVVSIYSFDGLYKSKSDSHVNSVYQKYSSSDSIEQSNQVRHSTTAFDDGAHQSTTAFDHQNPSDTLSTEMEHSLQLETTQIEVSVETSVESDSNTKRQNIIDEIIETEKSFLNDLIVLKEVYMEPSYEVFTNADVKLLFSNLNEIITVSKSVLDSLLQYPEYIGYTFIEKMKIIESSYATYCKNNESSLVRIQELSQSNVPLDQKQFLENAKVQMQGRTNAWDLASMVVKPVQRVLKYPLLIKRLLKETDFMHPDYENLKKADEQLELVAVLINEVKKRKDIVEKYVQGKQSINVLHGLNKKMNRGKQMLKKTTGMSEEIADQAFDTILQRFDKLYQGIPNIEKAIQQWTKSIKDYVDVELSIIMILEEAYQSDGSGSQDVVYCKSVVKRYRQDWDRIMSGPFADMQRSLKQSIYPALQTLLKQFKSPLVVIKKRQAKVLDYEQYKEILLRNEEVDPILKESVDVYESINAQLIEEVPKFLDYCLEYLYIVTGDVVKLQQAFFDQIRTVLGQLCDSMGTSHIAIIEEYNRQMEAGNMAEIAARDLKILAAWHESIWGHLSTGKGTDSLIDFQTPPKTNEIYRDSQVQPNKTLPTFDYQVEALYRFQAEFEDELDMEIGDIITVVTDEDRHGSDEWSFGQSTRGQGWFPKTYVQRI